MNTIVLWLFVLNLGIAFGAGVYEHRIVVSRWMGFPRESGVHWNAEAARQDDTGRRFWAFVSTLPLTLLTLANLVAGWRAAGPVRGWWLAAALIALADRLFTFSYFIPTMVGLMSAPDGRESVAIATRWSNLNYLRHAVVFAAWLASLHAFALLYQEAGSAGSHDPAVDIDSVTTIVAGILVAAVGYARMFQIMAAIALTMAVVFAVASSQKGCCGIVESLNGRSTGSMLARS